MDQERIQVLCTLDIEGARKMIGKVSEIMSDEGIVVGMHKTRLHSPWIPMYYRQESLAWLRANGFKDIGGAPLPNQVPV